MLFRSPSPWLGAATLDPCPPLTQAALAPPLPPAHMAAMLTRDQWHRFIDHPAVEWTIFVVGVILMLLSPLAGIIPGPGGIFVFAIGLAMVLKTSMWAKRHYVRFKTWQPKAGRWADWGLRRPSARRREALRKERESAATSFQTDQRAEILPAPPAWPPEMPGDRERSD